MICYFVSDLHGSISRYQKLFEKIEQEHPQVVFLGGDLLPSGIFAYSNDAFKTERFLEDFLFSELLKLKNKMKTKYPSIFTILGNDDGVGEEDKFFKAEEEGLLKYVHNKIIAFDGYEVIGYNFVPPTPFQLKDWERYDVSRFVDPGCVSPEAGFHSREIEGNEIKYATIEKDLNKLAENKDVSKTVFLFHAPPYKTNLDRAALDGKMIDHVPLDVHVGSVAIRRFIEKRQPLLTLHGHIHESSKLTNSWQDKFEGTYCFSAAHDGFELSLIRFDLNDITKATRALI